MAPRNNDHEMELRLEKLEEDMDAVRKQVEAITDDIHGTASQPGVFEQLRSMHAMEVQTQFLVKETSNAVTSFKHDQVRVKGMLIAAGALMGAIGWVINLVFNYLKATH